VVELTIYLGPNAPGERPAKPVRSSRKLDVPSVTCHDDQNDLSGIVMYPDEFTEITQNPTGLVPGVRNVSQTVARRVSDRRQDQRLDAVKDLTTRDREGAEILPAKRGWFSVLHPA